MAVRVDHTHSCWTWIIKVPPDPIFHLSQDERVKHSSVYVMSAIHRSSVYYSNNYLLRACPWARHCSKDPGYGNQSIFTESELLRHLPERNPGSEQVGTLN